MKFLSPFLLLI